MGAVLFPAREEGDEHKEALERVKNALERIKLLSNLRTKYNNLEFFFYGDSFGICCKPRNETSEEDFECTLKEIRNKYGIYEKDVYYIKTNKTKKNFRFERGGE